MTQCVEGLQISPNVTGNPDFERLVYWHWQCAKAFSDGALIIPILIHSSPHNLRISIEYRLSAAPCLAEQVGH